jgi:polyferredoxin
MSNWHLTLSRFMALFLLLSTMLHLMFELLPWPRFLRMSASRLLVTGAMPPTNGFELLISLQLCWMDRN